jgi:chromate transporter
VSTARAGEVFLTALRLGCTSFGGPVAHLGYFERTYVRQRQWLGAEEYAGLLALCQALPGPASSQLGFLIGWHRAGWPGALLAWIGFTLPSALLMGAAALLAARFDAPAALALLHGLQLMAVAVVGQALWSMAPRLCPDWPTRGLALLAAAVLLLAGSAGMQLAALALGALGGWLLCKPAAGAAVPDLRIPSRLAWAALLMFALLLLGLPLLALQAPRGHAALAAIFYRSGALVFGGGHVVLPLLRDALVPQGWIGDERFLAGYGFAQALPGPLFSFAAYLGAANQQGLGPLGGAALATLCIFLPGLLLAVAGAAWWGRMARQRAFGAALAGINAAVVGILAAALYDPVCTTAIRGLADAPIAVAGFILLQRWKVSPLAVLLLCVASSCALALA